MLKIFVKAEPGSKEESIVQLDSNHFKVSVKEPPVRGLANRSIIRILSDYFGVSLSSVRIISGYTSRQKVIEIKDL